MADRLFFQDLFTDNTKMAKKISRQRSHYDERLRLTNLTVVHHQKFTDQKNKNNF